MEFMQGPRKAPDGTPRFAISSLLQKSKISVVAQLDSCGTWSETPKTGFLMTRLIQSVEFVKSRICKKGS